MNKLKRFVALALVLCMVMAWIPVGASAAADDFLRVFHLDCGRRFFSLDEVKSIIDTMSASGYTHLELAIGNDGLRLLLDDMSVGSYTHADVAAGIQEGNKAYSHSGEWTESEMDEIIAYADAANIEIIPLVNTPGHMDAIITAMEYVGMTSPAYGSSVRTVDVTDAAAVAFTQELVGKYAEYFASKGCTYFNMGADEYANDAYTSGSMGFGHLQSAGLYDEYAAYINEVSAIIEGAGMTPIAFNDGFYFNNETEVSFDTDIVIAYWTSGWSGYTVASAATVAGKGHKILNTNDGWYYVVGRSSGTYGYSSALSNAKSTAVTDVSGSDDPDVIGAMNCVWYDTPSVSYASYEEDVHTLITTLAENNADYYMAASSDEGGEDGVTFEAAVPADAEERTVTVNLGGSATDTISGGEYSADETDLDKSIATVSVKTSPAAEATVSYAAASVTCNNLISSNSTRINTGYYYLANGSYYPLYASRTRSNNRYTYTWYYSTDNGSTFEQIGTQTTNNTGSTPNITVYTKSATDAVPASTTVTFAGVALGTTYVQVANVYYTINVVDEAPDNAMTGSSVTLEYWITNLLVYTSQSTNSATSVSITASEASTEEGVALNTKAPGVAYSNFDGWVTLYYWQSMRLDSANEQTTASGDDETADGTAMTHVRYHNGAWQYKTAAGYWNYFESGDQLVAYYLQKTDLTDQIVTYSKDWGYDTGSTTPDTSSGSGQVALSVAVVDGNNLSPAESDIYAESTTIFNYWSGRDIGLVAPENNSNYEIYKITVTDGTRTSNSSANVWYTSDSITWDKTTIDLGDGDTSEWFDEREVWNISEGTTPMVNGKIDGVTWPAKNTAVLVLIYIRATNANLTVKYVDDSLDGALIHERGVFADDDGTFVTDLKQTSPVPESGYFTLDDNATLTYYNEDTQNSIVQTFEKSLLNFQDIAPQYRSGAYEYVGAEIADDGKTLILHYDINEEKLNPKYVVDFGLSVSVPLDEVIENHTDATKIEVVSAAYGSAVISGDTLTYTPSSVLLAPAAVPVRATYADGTVAVRNLGFIPASTVNYEEGFAALTGSWTAGSTGSGEQGLQTATNNEGNYGYDAKYAAETGMTNGTQAVSAASGDKAELTFTGTGVDVYANCDATTSTVAALLYRADGSLVKMYQVDTSAVSGSSAATDGQDVTSYSLPIVSVQGLTHGTYKLVIQHTKPADDAAEFRLDGFRVYNTMTDMTDYAADENAPEFVELRNAVLKGAGVTESTASDPYNWSGALIEQVYNEEGTLEGALVLSGNAEYSVQDLLENGPKNELFLQPGDAVTFTVSGTAQIGLKALNGEAKYTVNGTGYTITTSADMFYHEGTTGAVSIVNTGSTILSLTKLKLFGSLEQVSAEQVVATLSLMGLEVEDEVPELPEFTAPETDYADAALTVDVVDYKGRTVAAVSLTANGVKGESHTFTAGEITATVKAQLPEGYALADESRVADVRVVYGKDGTAKVQAGKTAVVKIAYVGLLNSQVVGETEIVVVQTSDRSWYQLTAAEIRAGVPAGRVALKLTGMKVAYGCTYSLVVPVI